MQRQLDEAIRDRLRYGGPATWAELAAAVDAHPARVQRRCDALQEAGEIRATTGGCYTLVEHESNAGSTSNATSSHADGTPAPSD